MKNVHFNKKYFLIIIILLAGLLRIPLLDQFPPALYSDEVSQGYNAYSILKTGKDEYGVVMPLSFRSFGDWKPPLPTYVMVPTIALFGLTPVGVRLPSAVLGTLTVLMVYFLVIELLKIIETEKSATSNLLKRQATVIAVVSSLLLAISPWHIHQSRAAMLISVELFCLVAALLTFLKGLRNSNWWILSAVLWSLTLYSYYAMRMIVPIFLIFLFLYFRKKITKSISPVFFVAMAIDLIMLLPLGIQFFNQPDIVFGRAKTVSIFYDKGVALTVWDLIAKDGPNMPNKLAQFLHNKPYLYAADLIRRFFQHFDGRFLYLVGDKHPPFQIPGMGIMYLLEGLFISIGLVYLIQKKTKVLGFLLFWIVISVLPAALTFVTPAANRTFTMVVPLLILSAVGLVVLVSKVPKYTYLLSGIIGIGYMFCFAYFLYQYTAILPTQHAAMWHYGYQELYTYLHTQEVNTEVIYVSGKASVPYVFYLFYQQIDPRLAQSLIEHNFTADEFGFEHVDAIGKYEFPRYFSWDKDRDELLAPSILVTTGGEKVGDGPKMIQEITYPNGDVAFRVYSLN